MGRRDQLPTPFLRFTLGYDLSSHGGGGGWWVGSDKLARSLLELCAQSWPCLPQRALCRPR